MGERLHACGERGCHTLIPVGARYCVKHKDVHAVGRAQSYKQYDDKRKHDKERSSRNKFYRDKPWLNQRIYILKRDHELCRYCDMFDDVTPATLVDHIVPREIDSSIELDEDNLVSSCASCHRTKTLWEQEHYGTGERQRLKRDAVRFTDIQFLKPMFAKTRGL